MCDQEREDMVRTQIVSRGVGDDLVLKAMRKVRRHEYVSRATRDMAYVDAPLPIGCGQTISQPYMVAFMTEALGLTGGERVLEIGTGSGYQTAVLAEIASEVYTIEIVAELYRAARERLISQGYGNIYFRHGDGYAGWPEKVPFDAIVVTAAPPEMPGFLKKQLKNGGKMVVPVGTGEQELYVVERTAERSFHEKDIMPVRFVPMVHAGLGGDDERSGR
ncbi:MAG: protein-L-isoaspartate(D-aspartate) O-methyltransferase [Candidatus Omnitrophica bacterium]|nr:protein-L-isoaspartate(D-aspartate) O-methyltransferase [Candidatus Omnitrophota bacterium]MDD5488079.1 protein-L-isoaspartate(D-aspartate) O-methyltransferase [Candidatus Omnitrophota bacterium]